MKIRNYQPGDDAFQLAVYNQAAAHLPNFKPATIEDIRRRCQAADFDPAGHFFAEENGKVVGYAMFNANGRVNYPWALKGSEGVQEPLFDAVVQTMKARKMPLAFAAYRGDWGLQTDFFRGHDFSEVREMVNFVLDIVDMPTPAARPSLPFSPLRREDVPAVFALAPETLRVKTPAELERHLFENTYFKPDALFVLRDRSGGDTPAAVGILLDNPSFGDAKQVDANMPCFRLGAFGTEGMQAKRLRGMFSFVARAGYEFSRLGMDMMGQAAFRLEESDTPWLAAQVPSDVPYLHRFYQQLFRRQGSFPVFEKALA